MDGLRVADKSVELLCDSCPPETDSTICACSQPGGVGLPRFERPALRKSAWSLGAVLGARVASEQPQLPQLPCALTVKHGVGCSP
ncbi:hypothetical protein SAMN04489729_6936 [Amycolatopsis lurida]|nr:hypothetical protein SAMN04489729_6936 [Amycolatopsis lurida]